MSTAQLANDVTRDGLLPPVASPPPNAARPTMSPMEAQMESQEPRPPHAAQVQESGVSFDQAINGIHQSYNRFRTVEAAYTTIRAVMQGSREAPIVAFPTGQLDEDGTQIVYEMDLTATLPSGTGVTAEDRLEAIQKQLIPWNNHLVEEYERWLDKLAMYAGTATTLLQEASATCRAKQQAPQQPQATSPATTPVRQVQQVPPVPGQPPQ